MPTTELFAANALLSTGWARDVRFSIDAGRIAAIAVGQPPGSGDSRADVVLPGLGNAHSHAFQRALCGFAEQASPADRDNFWSWRQRMYQLAASLDEASQRSVAAQAYCEMLEAGFTSVAEFHYLHRDRDGAMSGSMRDALFDAALQTGIRLTYVPVLYERGGFDDRPLDDTQQRFALDVDAYSAHVAESMSLSSRTQPAAIRVAAGAHSLRAVTRHSLHAIAELAAVQGIPLHLHVAEQPAEVEQCLDATGARPVQWLIDNAAVDERWCLVHATHIDAIESRALAASGAVVCLCPTTEANLGDGLFPLPAFLQHGGRFAIGSDSHASIDPFEELRWLEYGQRLSTLSRNVIAAGDGHSGLELYQRALAGGSRALGEAGGGLQPGAAADLIAVQADTPALAGHDPTTYLDALIFGGRRARVNRVMVHGDWQVVDGHHQHSDTIGADYRKTMQRLKDTP